MTAYVVRRVGQSVAVVIGVMILTFVLIHMEPGSAARATLGTHATASRIAIFNSTYGLNEPLDRQFVTYLDQVVHGNLGTSYALQQPVSSLIAQRLPRDFLLLGLSTVLALLIALPLGIYQAVRRNGRWDYVYTGAAFTLYSMPDFFFAILLIAVFSVQLQILPPEAPQATTVAGMLADPRALVLPVVTLGLISVASYSRYMRSSAIDTLAQEHIKVARAKGLPERLVLSRHVAGAVIAEAVFNYPGMGLLFYQAATSHDFPVLLGSTLVVGISTVIGSLAADIVYAVLDPRIRYGHA